MQISSLILLWKWLKSLWAAVWRQPGVLDWHFPFVQKGKVEKSRDAGALVKSLRGHLLELDQKSYVKKKKKKEKETEKESSRGLWVGTVCKAQLCVCVCAAIQNREGSDQEEKLGELLTKLCTGKPEVWHNRAIFILVRMCTRCMTCKLHWQTKHSQWATKATEVWELPWNI